LFKNSVRTGNFRLLNEAKERIEKMKIKKPAQLIPAFPT